ncbi:MAG: PSD1 and planctomycete cytochrome C domain-containing protein [Planctomycetaceae bacterium]
MRNPVLSAIHRSVAILALLFTSAACGDDASPKNEAGLELFRSDVRSILIHQCLECHGGKSVKGKFDLSTREKLMESGYVGPTADESYVLELIRHEAEPHMPLKAPKLKREVIEKIEQWINLGAPYDGPLTASAAGAVELVVTDADREFWSFRPLAQDKPPAQTSDWCRNEVDQFVYSKLLDAKLHPNSLADRRTLIRRAYFDLIGLPPTYEEVEAFVHDTSPTAYEDLIDQLLDSEHYGERWARHWLDVARFAESHGYEQDYDRPNAYHYRDFVIKALNADMPFDQFASWQLAGDELAPDEPLALMATGFMGAGAFPTQLTEEEFESARYDELDDMVGTTGVAFLGLSIGCARCHDHKFDPIPAKDYYELVSTFRTAIRSEVELDLTPEKNEEARKQFESQLAALKSKREEVGQALAQQLAEKKNLTELAKRGTWELPQSAEVTCAQGSMFTQQNDGSWLASGAAPERDEFTLQGKVSPDIQFNAIRLEALTHESLPNRGPGRAGNGNFALGNISLEVINAEGATRSISLGAARATHQQNTSSLSVAASIDDDPVSGWAVDQGGIGKDQAAVFDFKEPVVFSKSDQISVKLTFNHPNGKHAMGHWRVSFASRPELPPEVGLQGVPSDIINALTALNDLPPGERMAHEKWDVLLNWYLSQQPEWAKLNEDIQQQESTGPAVQLAKVMVTSEGLPHLPHHADGRGFPHFYSESYYLTRGDVHQKGEIARQGFLQVLMRDEEPVDHWQLAPPEGWTRTSFRRASLANWLTDTNSGAGHLVARVIVNRLWQHHFGRGIVATPNDFGFQGERPTHPELLDWLARDLVENGWKLKRLHKLIMLSATYQQNGDWDEQRAALDQENLLLWRRGSKRLEGEAIRDSLLAVSGRLDSRMYGPGTLDQRMTRRSVYFFIKRSQLIPSMMLFDWPEHLVSIGQRSSTTIAPQALMFMNSPEGRTCAEALVQSIGKQDADETFAIVYQRIYSRNPTSQERSLAQQFLNQQRELYRKSHAEEKANQLALTDLCQALLSANEFCYVD